MLKEAGLAFAAQFPGAVRGEGIDHHDFVGKPGNGIEAAADIGLLVQRDDNGGQTDHVFPYVRNARSCS